MYLPQAILLHTNMIALGLRLSFPERGLTFRRTYRRVGELVSCISCPTVCLSATITKEIDRDLRQVLALDESSVGVAQQPDMFEYWNLTELIHNP